MELLAQAMGFVGIAVVFRLQRIALTLGALSSGSLADVIHAEALALTERSIAFPEVTSSSPFFTVADAGRRETQKGTP